MRKLIPTHEQSTFGLRQVLVPLSLIGLVILCVTCWLLIRPKSGRVPADLPRATLSINGMSQQAPVGTYCWTSARICSDRSQATQSEALKSSGDLRATLSFTSKIAPSEVSVHTNVVVAGAVERSERAPGISVWDWKRQPVGTQFPVRPVLSQEITFTLRPGRYLIDVFATWESRGDTAHTFLVDVDGGK